MSIINDPNFLKIDYDTIPIDNYKVGILIYMYRTTDFNNLHTENEKQGYKDFQEKINHLLTRFNKKDNQLWNYHYILWKNKLDNASDSLLLKIKNDTENTVKSYNRDKEKIYLTSMYIYHFSQNCPLRGTYCNSKNNKVVKVSITKKSHFHIIFRHYFRFNSIGMQNDPEKSLFNSHTYLQYIDDINEILARLDTCKLLSFSSAIEVLTIEYNSKKYFLVLKRKIPTEYDVVTYYEIIKPETLQKLSTATFQICGSIKLFSYH